jgi:hypothetical protein
MCSPNLRPVAYPPIARDYARGVDSWSTVVAGASVIALLVALGVRARHGPVEDRPRFGTLLLGAAAIVLVVGVIAFVWTLTRPT